MNATQLAALQAAARQFVSTHGETVTFRRGADVVGPAGGGPLRGVRGRRDGRLDQAAGVAVSADECDWLFLPDTLTLSGETVFPDMGDAIETAAGQTFDACAPQGEPVGGFTDQHLLLVRMHTTRR